MKIRSQVGMVLNLDKCIGCHTCSVTCKNVWSSREGMEYAWFNNVETKPGIGYPKNWEDQDQWQGGWIRGISGKLTPRSAIGSAYYRRFSPTRCCRRSTITTNPLPMTTSTCTTRRRANICRPPARAR
ncbi:Respiratory nitrate reductase beta chain [Klebsiella pneumoniae IS53]|nr:Respiratory nitrate reductase beta chain [Klebsiella pneumoniae IS53]